MHRHLITGGAGFIGSALARALLARGDRVRVIDDFSSGRRENLAELASHVEVIEGSILDQDALAGAMAGVKIVFHQAAVPARPRSLERPVESHEVNATGTLRVLEAARRAGVRRVVYAGSATAYGDNRILPKIETMTPTPASPDGASKLAGELYCRAYALAYGVETVCLRAFNVFGPRQDAQSEYAAVIPRFIARGFAGASPVIFGDGTQSRDFCFVDNVVDAHLKAAYAPKAAGQVYNVGAGTPTSLNEIVALIGTALGRPLTPRYEPARPDDTRHSVADISSARGELGYTAAIGLPEGLRKTIDWYRRHLPVTGNAATNRPTVRALA